MNTNIINLKDIKKDTIKLYGHKAIRLYELIQTNVLIPRGFIISSKEYFTFLQTKNNNSKINEILETIDYNNDEDIKEKSKQIQQIIINIKINDDLKTEIIKAYSKLSETKIGWLNSKVNEYVAIRCSLVSENINIPEIKHIEDEGGNINIRGIEAILFNIKKCWSILYTYEVLKFIYEKKININDLSIAIIVQKMIDATHSGILITSKNNEKTLQIEAIYGLCGRLLLNEITPDHYEINNNPFKVITKIKNNQEWLLKRMNGKTSKVNVFDELKDKQKLDIHILKDLTNIGKKIEEHFGTPQTVEWAINKKEIYIINSEPVNYEAKEKINNKNEQQKMEGYKKKLIDKGISVYKGIVHGNVKIIKNDKDLEVVDENNIIVINTVNDNINNCLEKIKGIISEEGSLISQVAILSQRLKKPCIVNCKGIMNLLKDNQSIEINGKTGEIYEYEKLNFVNLSEHDEIKFPKKEEYIEEKAKGFDVSKIKIDDNFILNIKICDLFTKNEICYFKTRSHAEFLQKLREKINKYLR